MLSDDDLARYLQDRVIPDHHNRPFVLGVIADLGRSYPEPGEWAHEVSFSEVTAENFDGFMSAVRPTLEIQVPNPVIHSEEIDVALTFTELHDFTAFGVGQQVLLVKKFWEGVAERPEKSDQVEPIVNKILRSICTHPEFLRLEAVWHSLFRLARMTRRGNKTQLQVLSRTKKEMLHMMRRYPGSKWDKSPLFHAIYSEKYDTLGGWPLSVLLVDYPIEPRPPEISFFRSLFKICSASYCHLVGNVAAQKIGVGDNGKPRSDLRLLERSANFALWRSLRDLEDSAFASFGTPQILARAPRGPQRETSSNLTYDDTKFGAHEMPWIGTGWALAEALFTALVDGKETAGTLTDLPWHHPEEDKPNSLDLSLSPDVCAQLSAIGVSPGRANKGAGHIYWHAPRTFFSEGNSAVLSGLHRCRVMHSVKAMVRDLTGMPNETDLQERAIRAFLAPYVSTDGPASIEKPIPGYELKRVDTGFNLRVRWHDS